MRKVIILGNGFDVSHGLKTKYEEFLYNYLVKCLFRSFENKKIIDSKFVYEHIDMLIHLNYNFIEFGSTRMNGLEDKHIYEFINEYNDFRKLMSELLKRKMVFPFHHETLLTLIYKNKLIYNWVDIELEYFERLKSILFDIGYPLKKERDISSIGEIVELNCELDFLKSELVYYLKCIDKENDSIEEIDDYKKMLFDLTRENKEYNSRIFVNFNYTNTLKDVYRESLNYSIINIHGSLDSNKEDIIFGYGNEGDSKFQDILKLREKDVCLKNFKMYKYSNSNNHSKINSFIEGNNFELVVIGHSCEISDSTLFTEILEHPNISSVKLYFYDKNNDGGKNEFQNLNMSISSHFKDVRNWRKLRITYDVNNKIPQSPINQIEIINKEYINSNFDFKEIYKHLELINNHLL